MTTSQHIPVLLNEVLADLSLESGETVFDGTLGGAGHSLAMAQCIGELGTLIALDQDKDAIVRATEKLKEAPCKVVIKENNFRKIDETLQELGISSIDKALLDLGWSSDQVMDPERGLSFQHDGPLTMTLKKNPSESDLTAFDVVNHWKEETLADIFYAYGDERYARRIARNISLARDLKSIHTTFELVEIIKKSVPHSYRVGRLHPATRTFQALRIIVNDEYGALTEALEKTLNFITPQGRFAVISFHSGEDKIVKEFFKQQEQLGTVKRLHKKPIIATEEELSINKKARSAKLRTIIKL